MRRCIVWLRLCVAQWFITLLHVRRSRDARWGHCRAASAPPPCFHRVSLRGALCSQRRRVCCAWPADVYERLTAPGKKPSLMTLVITQFVSGLWHGVFAGYALMFISCAFFFHSSKVRLNQAVEDTS